MSDLPASSNTVHPDHIVHQFIVQLAHQLGLDDLPSTTDGHCEFIIDDSRSLSIWPLPDASGVFMMADLPLPAGVDRESALRASLGYCMGASTENAPVIGMDENGDLVMLWALPAGDASPEYAEEAVTLFLESLTMAEATTSSNPVPKSPAAAGPAEPASPTVLAEIAAFFKLERLDFDDDGFVVCQNPNGSLVMLQYLGWLNRIAVLAQIHTTGRLDAELCQHALEFNYSSAAEGEPVLGLHEELDGLFLITTVSTHEERISDVEPTLERFLSRYALCNGQVADPDADDFGAVLSAGADNDEPSSETFATGIRV